MSKLVFLLLVSFFLATVSKPALYVRTFIGSLDSRAAFEKEIEGLPSIRSVGDLPPELHCPLCKEVMKDAVLTSKCCFTSFCDKCKISSSFLPCALDVHCFCCI